MVFWLNDDLPGWNRRGFARRDEQADYLKKTSEFILASKLAQS
jgi:hypothetical protein